MPLELKPTCERCGATLAPADEAYICTFECTFCPACTQALSAVCPNCGGELVRRPRPRSTVTTTAWRLLAWGQVRGPVAEAHRREQGGDLRALARPPG